MIRRDKNAYLSVRKRVTTEGNDINDKAFIGTVTWCDCVLNK